MRVGQAPASSSTGTGTAPAPPPPGPPRRWRRRSWVAAAVAALVVAGLVLVALWPHPDPRPTTADVNGIVDKKVGAAIAQLKGEPPDGVPVYDAIRLPLVAVHAEGLAASGGSHGLGAGVIVNIQGEILTSLHVVDGAASINVSFSDGTESPASVTGSDPDHDIAVLTPVTLPGVVVPAVLGGGVRVGDEAFAVGHPVGLAGSLSAGVVSGLDRSFDAGNGRRLGGMIQFDTAVNPGNSGGPLLNREGQVVGIVTGLVNPSGEDSFAGIGFAVPIGTAGGAAGAPAR